MAKKLFIFLASAGVAAAVVSAYASRMRTGNSTKPLLETSVGSARKLADEWRSADSITNEFASVVADEVASAR